MCASRTSVAVVHRALVMLSRAMHWTLLSFFVAVIDPWQISSLSVV